jgi:hypothetical protein
MSDNSNYTTQFKDFVNKSGAKLPYFYKYFSTILIRILDKIVNGFTIKEKGVPVEHKYYRYFISIVLILILCLFYYLNEKQNLFAIKNTKYEILFALMLIAFSIYCFLFFVYRNNTSWDKDKSEISDTGKKLETSDTGKKQDEEYDTELEYSNIYNLRKLINPDTGPGTSPDTSSAVKAESKGDDTSTVNKKILKNTLSKPLFNMMKYLFYLLLIILIPLFVINYTLYLHKNNDNVFNITKNIVGLLIVLIVLAIIAKLFSIKTSSESNYCDIPVVKGKKPEYTDLITNYAKYFLCIFKNFIFFIPCLLVILVDEINKDIRLTPSPVYILFFLLLLLVLLLFLLPVIFKYIRTFNKSDILQGEGPFYLNKEKHLGKYQNLNTHLSKSITLPNITREETSKPSEDKLDKIMSAFNMNKEELTTTLNRGIETVNANTSLNSSIDTLYNKGSGIIDSKISIKDTSNNGSNVKAYTFTLFNDINSAFNIKSEYHNSVISKEKFPYNYTYSVTFYIYINPQPENTSLAYTKDTVLFNYGFKPIIYYNGKSQKIIIKSRTISNRGDQLDTIYEMSNPKFQKWLFFVINYDNNLIDIFIDGKLVGSKENVSPYFKGDNITIGENDGIHGSIKEIYYYNKITSPSTIELLYNLSKNNDSEKL